MPLFGYGTKHEWIVVVHTWFVDSVSWHHEHLPCATRDEAEAYAALMVVKKLGPHIHCSSHLIQLPD